MVSKRKNISIPHETTSFCDGDQVHVSGAHKCSVVGLLLIAMSEAKHSERRKGGGGVNKTWGTMGMRSSRKCQEWGDKTNRNNTQDLTHIISAGENHPFERVFC